MLYKAAVGILLFALLFIPGMTPLNNNVYQHPSAGTATPTEANVADAYGRLPPSFIANNGQTDPSVLYYAHVSGGKVYLTSDSIVLDLARREKDSVDDLVTAMHSDRQEENVQRLVVRLNL